MCVLALYWSLLAWAHWVLCHFLSLIAASKLIETRALCIEFNRISSIKKIPMCIASRGCVYKIEMARPRRAKSKGHREQPREEKFSNQPLACTTGWSKNNSQRYFPFRVKKNRLLLILLNKSALILRKKSLERALRHVRKRFFFHFFCSFFHIIGQSILRQKRLDWFWFINFQ